MSTQKAVRIAVAVSLVALSAVLAGCGDKPNLGSQQASGQEQSSKQGEVTSSGATTETDLTGPTGEQAPDTIASPDDPGAGDEEAVRVPVELAFKNARFTAGTKRLVHVPAFTPIELELDITDAVPVRFYVSYKDDEGPFNFPPLKAKRRVQLGGLRPDDAYRITAKGETVRVVADLEPGP